MRTKKRTAVCLIAGVALLAVSATAAFGSITGYSQYKDSVITLALEEENFSGLGHFSLTLDDQPQMDVAFTYHQDGPDRSSHFTGTEFGRPVDTWDVMIDGVSTWFSLDSDYYYHQGETEDPPNTFLTIDTDDEYEARILNFLNVAADTVVGELKNNFVQIGTQDGVALYQVDISQEQIPTLVTAGLSLLAVSQGISEEFAGAFTQDLALENIHCTFGVDADGNLTQNYIAVTFVTTGRDGLTHEVVISGEVELFDYGTTTVTLPDLGDRTELAMGKPTSEAVVVEEW